MGTSDVRYTSRISIRSSVIHIISIIYINDDTSETSRSMCKLFADDSKLYLTIKSRNEQEIIQSDLLKFVTGLKNG